MSIYVIQDSGDIVESVRTPQGQLPMQKVLKNRELVQGILDYKRSHFSVAENVDIFQGYSLDHNFGILRQMCGLGDPKTEHVTSLITGFSVTAEDGQKHDIVVGEGKYKSALFLYWLAEGQDQFQLNGIDRGVVLDYFGPAICNDAMNNPQTKHTTVKHLLHTFNGGCHVTITRPKPEVRRYG